MRFAAKALVTVLLSLAWGAPAQATVLWEDYQGTANIAPTGTGPAGHKAGPSYGNFTGSDIAITDALRTISANPANATRTGSSANIDFGATPATLCSYVADPAGTGAACQADAMGRVIYALVKFPAAGTYAFDIAHDDNIELNLSSDYSNTAYRSASYDIPVGRVASYTANDTTFETLGSFVAPAANSCALLRLYWNNYGGINHARLRWDPPGVAPVAIIPASAFFDPSVAANSADCAATIVPGSTTSILVNKTIANGRISAADQFRIALRDNSNAILASGTTSGTGIGQQASTGAVVVPNGQTYRLTDEMAAGSVHAIGSYASAIACRRNGTAFIPGGAAPNWTVVPNLNEQIVCTITNTGPVPAPALTIVKSAEGLTNTNGDGVVGGIGDQIVYHFTVTNTGNVDLTGVTVSDALAGVAITGGPIPLAAGQSDSSTFTATYTIKTADFLGGGVHNSATATGTPPGGPPVNSPPSTVDTPVPAHPALSIVKSAEGLANTNGDGVVGGIGDVITYHFTLTNTGNVDLTGVTVNDALAGAVVSGGPIDLAAGQSDGSSFTATYTITTADFLGHGVQNTATASGAPPGGGPPVTSPPSTVTTPVPAAPSLVLAKSAAPLSDTNGDGTTGGVGDNVTYSFTLTNTGNVDLAGLSIADAAVTVSGSLAMLAAGRADSTSFTAIHTITQADLDAGRVDNTATASGTDPAGGLVTSPPSSAGVVLQQSPALSIVKSAEGLANTNSDGLVGGAGDDIVYHFTVTNTGNVTLTGITVSDTLTAIIGGPVTLAPGQSDSASFTATYTITPTDIGGGGVDNSATATGTPPTGPPVTSPPSTVHTPVPANPALSIVKSAEGLADTNADGVVGDAGDVITYHFVVTNTGNIDLAGITVTDTLAGVVVIGGPVSLAPGQSDPTTFTATYTILPSDFTAGGVDNSATATGTPPTGPPVTSPPSTVHIVVPAVTSLAAVKTAAPLSDTNSDGIAGGLGDTIQYGFVVTNTGNVDLADVQVRDGLLGVVVIGGPIDLAPGQSDATTFTARYTITQADLNAGQVENAARATGLPPGSPTPITSPPSQVVTPVVANSGLGIVKAASVVDGNADGYASVGDTVDYTFTVTNTGTVDLANVQVADPGPSFDGQVAAGVLGPITPAAVPLLSPGQSTTFTASYALQQADIDHAAGIAGAVSNSAVATGEANSVAVQSAPDTAVASLSLQDAGNITVTKQALVQQIHRGESAQFVIIAQNHASNSAGIIAIVDRVPAGFRYVAGLGSVDGVAREPDVTGATLSFGGLTLAGGQTITLRLTLEALSTATPGRHVNQALVLDPAGKPLAPPAEAGIDVLAEGVFDCSDIIGKVFDDRDRDGYQDKGEPGLPGVRLATARGMLVTTDRYGRYSIPCAALPDADIGSNFILKLDERTLPTGYGVTTKNPEVARLTAGKMAEINFGASIGRQVRLDLDDAAFAPGGVEPVPALDAGLATLVKVLGEQHSILLLHYDAQSGASLGAKRLAHIEQLIRARWRQAGAPYELVVEARLQSGSAP